MIFIAVETVVAQGSAMAVVVDGVGGRMTLAISIKAPASVLAEVFEGEGGRMFLATSAKDTGSVSAVLSIEDARFDIPSLVEVRRVLRGSPSVEVAAALLECLHPAT
jgi:hypothetical protein